MSTQHSVTMSLREARARAASLFREGRFADSERICRAALAARPGDFGALRLLALALARQRRPQEALEAHDRALAVRPEDAKTLNNRGVALRELRRTGEALQSLDRAVALEPGYAEAWHNRGSVLGDLGRTDEALHCYDRAVALKPSFAEAHFNRGNALRDLERYDAALQSYDRAIALHPSYADAIFNRGLISLVRGDLRAGWAAYESRWDRAEADLPRRAFPEPVWLGEDPIDGRTILLHAEQGLGDTLQFVRYAPLLAGRGATVHLEVQPALKSLLHPLPGVAAVFARGEDLPAFDAHCPLMSLPLAFGTTLETIPAQIPYVGAPPDRAAEWARRLGERAGKLRVGLVWSGNPAHKNDRNRSITLQRLERLLAMTGVQFVSLQKDARPADVARLAEIGGVLDVTSQLADFADTAALVANLDLVIGVDTSVVHLAGAMGKPVWVLLPHAPDWRWLLDREDSPWYPTARLFRQPEIGDWTTVVERVRTALREMSERAIDGTASGSAPPASPRSSPANKPTVRVERTHASQAWQDRLRVNPGDFEALHALGRLAAKKGDLRTAEAMLRQAISVDAGVATAHNDLGDVLGRHERAEEALACFDRALSLRADFAEAWFNHGATLARLRRHEAALQSYERAIAARPGWAAAHNNRGIVLRQLGRLEAAVQSYDRAIALDPGLAEAWSNRGIALRDLGQSEAALRDYDRAIALRPGLAKTHSNRGNALRDLERYDNARDSYDRAIELEPGYAEARTNRSLLALLRGDFGAGWAEYEQRWNRPESASDRRDYPQPLWQGQGAIAGKTILLHAEQGLGDTLQFVRYAALLAQRGATVHLEVQPPLKSLLVGMARVTGVFARGERLPPFDLHCPLLSLPLAFGTELETIPAGVPYVQAPAKKTGQWARRLEQSGHGPRVGLVWSGNPKHRNDRNRSIPFDRLRPLLDAPGVQFVSLQKELRDGDAAALDRCDNLLDASSQLHDFADTAALVASLDLVIGVDTSVVHLAGALGKPVWVLLPRVPDWRWLLDRDDSPWYPSARLFRRPAHGDWNGAIERVRLALDAWAAAERDQPASVSVSRPAVASVSGTL